MDKLKTFSVDSRARIEAPTPVGADFALRRERFWHQWAMAFSTASEREAGDPDFDRSVFLASDDPRIARAFRKSPEARRIAKDMLLSKCPGIDCKDSLLHLQLTPGKLKGDALEEFLAKAHSKWSGPLEGLAITLRQAEPDLEHYKPEPTAGIGSKLTATFWILAIIYACLFFWFLASGAQQSIDWDAARLPWRGWILLFSLQTFAICALAISTHRHSARLPLAFGQALGFSFLFAMASTPLSMHLINAKLPSSAPVASYISSVSPVQVKVKHGYTTRYLVETPPEKALNEAGILRQNLVWKSSFDANKSWKHDMGMANQAQVWIQKGFLGLPLVRGIEPCQPDKPCQPTN